MSENQKILGKHHWDFSEEELDAADRRKRWSMRNLNDGLCAQCGKEAIARPGGRLGIVCLGKQRERMAKRTGAKKRYRRAFSRQESETSAPAPAPAPAPPQQVVFGGD